ncbi:DUF19 domain-containing protein [Caenorhabditis elegans]|uniref:DUF19 domain-containing protein n=1 Tax=Caenorhabditis elegans TaxID=6239 RepID=A8WHT2_CAEEL|nr:DUF19 domain-containing protein [Caenorhabditis elegans]CAP19358.1 DUF19 domain-containing protein [Caenorhabditis elegans]|eukprot:NP_001123074.1 Uncharacterized protein CELE_ZC412.10 [Caenorhabditis elegans]
MNTLLTFIVFLALFLMAYSMPNPPSFPIKEICAAYGEKCVNKFNRRDCPERTIECERYANQGIRTTWSFCMFSNNYDLSACHERIQVDFQIIQSWISKDQFKYLPE